MMVKGKCVPAFVLLFLFLSIAKATGAYSAKVDVPRCPVITSKYDDESCKTHWNCTAEKILKVWSTIERSDVSGSDVNVSSFKHTPLLLRVAKGKLHCVQHPRVKDISNNLTIKAYRALHYINRLNRILRKSSTAILEGTEWWTHQADRVKIPLKLNPFPLFGYSGAKGYADIAGIPFMSFSDKLGRREDQAFREIRKRPWKTRIESIFFHGTLSDCSLAKEKFNGDINYCARAKIVFEAAKTKLPVLKDVATTSNFKKLGLSVDCMKCQKERLTSQEFVAKLCSHKYLLNIPGVGQSRRMFQLLRSGGVIFQSENSGFQFYDLDLKPGFHYVTFDPQLGTSGAGNLVSRLHMAKKNDESLRRIAVRAESYATKCLTESNIDYFVTILLERYSRLLTGHSSNFPLVDLSECVTKNEKQSVSRICTGIIRKCWFGT